MDVSQELEEFFQDVRSNEIDITMDWYDVQLMATRFRNVVAITNNVLDIESRFTDLKCGGFSVFNYGKKYNFKVRK